MIKTLLVNLNTCEKQEGNGISLSRVSLLARQLAVNQPDASLKVGSIPTPDSLKYSYSPVL